MKKRKFFHASCCLWMDTIAAVLYYTSKSVFSILTDHIAFDVPFYIF